MDGALLRKLPDFDQLLIGIAIEQWLRYLVVAGFAWLLGYVWFRQRWLRRKINPRYPSTGDMWREFRWSLLTVVIYGLVGAATIWAVKLGWTQTYRKISLHGWPWFAASIGIAIVMHDTWFYWTHRLMHHRKLFRWFHKVHHESTNPSPWAAYSFAPLEAFMQALIFPIVMFTLPMHPLAFVVFMVWQIIFNVAGHTGYEFYPRWLMDSWLGKVISTPTNHAMHHEKMRGNYGLYFNVWDRLMGTNHADYEQRFREVTSR
jgi:sterol desaturase/sphingolipid hydroxylase (fatty acid hydroxylase superfamily)